MKHASWIVGLALALAVAAPAAAEDRKEVQGYAAAGYVMPTGKAGDLFDGGWNVSGGVIFRPNPARPFGLRVDLGYSEMDASSKAIGIAQAANSVIDNGRMSVGNLSVDALWEFGNARRVGGYIGLGVGGYRRYVAATANAIVPGYICDPWYGCYYANTVGEYTVADDTLTKFGYNASVGMTFGLGPGQLYVEARYHYMITDAATEIIPVLIGYRF